MLQGTLDLLILKSLVLGPAHGHAIAHQIERGSDNVLQVEHGSLYPALHRLEHRSLVASFWGTSENNRKAKYYRLTPAGRRALATETSRWEQLARAVGRILQSRHPIGESDVVDACSAWCSPTRAGCSPQACSWDWCWVRRASVLLSSCAATDGADVILMAWMRPRSSGKSSASG